jgi:uncharacterized protein YdcH (DUF465 family)
MSHVPHEIAEMFPRDGDKLKQLADGDRRIAKLMERYHELSGEIRMAEENVNPTDDTMMESMKRQRLAILDDLRAALERTG